MEAREWEELDAILRAHLRGRPIWVFGSRATRRRVRRYSDLDLAVGGDAPPLGALAALNEALDESCLPFKVDVAVVASMSPEFRARIEAEMVLVQER